MGNLFQTIGTGPSRFQQVVTNSSAVSTGYSGQTGVYFLNNVLTAWDNSPVMIEVTTTVMQSYLLDNGSGAALYAYIQRNGSQLPNLAANTGILVAMQDNAITKSNTGDIYTYPFKYTYYDTAPGTGTVTYSFGLYTQTGGSSGTPTISVPIGNCTFILTKWI